MHNEMPPVVGSLAGENRLLQDLQANTIIPQDPQPENSTAQRYCPFSEGSHADSQVSHDVSPLMDWYSTKDPLPQDQQRYSPAPDPCSHRHLPSPSPEPLHRSPQASPYPKEKTQKKKHNRYRSRNRPMDRPRGCSRRRRKRR